MTACICNLEACEYPDGCQNVQCIYCAFRGAARVEMRLEAAPPGTWSLAGSQPKTAATEWPWMVCRESLGGCGHASRAKFRN